MLGSHPEPLQTTLTSEVRGALVLSAMAVSFALPPRTLLDFIIGDFENAWNSIAKNTPGSGGNFAFGNLATILLELACRICDSDTSGQALTDFGAELYKRDPRYFWKLPVSFAGPKGATLPAVSGVNPDEHVLAAIYELVRNGQAHQYQGKMALLDDQAHFAMSLTGVSPGSALGSTTAEHHLDVLVDPNAQLVVLVVRPDILFIDLRDAILGANLRGRGLTLKPFEHRAKGADLKSMTFALGTMNAAHPRTT